MNCSSIARQSFLSFCFLFVFLFLKNVKSGFRFKKCQIGADIESEPKQTEIMGTDYHSNTIISLSPKNLQKIGKNLETKKTFVSNSCLAIILDREVISIQNP